MRILECGEGIIFEWAYSNGIRPSFPWVYDYGMNSSQQLIQNAIQKYKNKITNKASEILNFLFAVNFP